MESCTFSWGMLNSVLQHGKYVHFHLYRVMQNNEKRSSNKTTSHNYDSDPISTSKHGNLFARWMLHASVRFELESQNDTCSCSIACCTQRPQWLAFIVCVKMKITHCLSPLETMYTHPDGTCIHTWNNMRRHTYTHYAQRTVPTAA